jgi:hypothetical protein
VCGVAPGLTGRSPGRSRALARGQLVTFRDPSPVTRRDVSGCAVRNPGAATSTAAMVRWGVWATAEGASWVRPFRQRPGAQTASAMCRFGHGLTAGDQGQALTAADIRRAVSDSGVLAPVARFRECVAHRGLAKRDDDAAPDAGRTERLEPILQNLTDEIPVRWALSADGLVIRQRDVDNGPTHVGEAKR